MIIKLNKKIKKVLEDNEIKLYLNSQKDCNGKEEAYAEISFFSPLGEDVLETFFFDGTSKGFIEAFKTLYEDFDPEDHASMWIEARGTRGVPSSIRALLDDADRIDGIFKTVSEQLEKVA